MFIYAHIDDMEAASGGLVKILPSLKSSAHIVVMTNGDKGCSNPDLCGTASNEELAEIRKEEQYKSGEILGIPQDHMHFLDYEDCELKMYSRSEVSKKVVNLIRSIQPNVVMTWDSAPYFSMTPSEGWGDLGYHPDHQYSGELTVDAVWYASEGRMWPELGAAWRPQQVYFWAYNPDIVPSHCLDITGDPHTAKTEAFLQMKSQYTNATEIQGMLAQLGVLMAETCLWSPGVMAEGYQFILW
jgi:LmbE family N-acetylglucosaminyl deacetylase